MFEEKVHTAMKDIPPSGDIAVEGTASGSTVDKYKRIKWSSIFAGLVSDNFKADVDRYRHLENKSWLYVILNRQGLWALAEYRFSRWACTKIHTPVIRQILRLFCHVWHKLIEITTGIDLPYQADIGKGLYIGHFGGIIVNPSVKMGEYCNLSQDITIGIAGRGEMRGSPTIGDRVYVGSGARLIGRITIGNDVAIGANAVVTKDLPDNAVAVGVPAKIISYEGSRDFVAY
jgi:serine O-acetyltransferase